MIVFRDHDRTADPGPVLAGLLAHARAAGSERDALVELLIELGVLEAAIMDALFAEADGLSPLAAALRRASLLAGRMVHAAWKGRPLVGLPEALAAALHEVAGFALPSPVRLKTPEGYAYYALHPEMYLAAAERFAIRARPGRALVVGLRSIGTSLSALVAATLEAEGVPVESLTLRPRGHPFGRRPSVTTALDDRLRRHADGFCLVVDEGPGLSGSSFCGTAAFLSALGVPDTRIVLFPSREVDPAALVSEEARARWGRHACEHVPFEAAVLPGAPFPAGSRELSGGAWRALAYGTDEAGWPAAATMFERRKFLTPEGVLHKFVGLGGHGRAAAARAATLAEAGFGPPVLGLRQGFLAQPWVEGRRLGAGAADAAFLGPAAAYLGHLARHLRTGAEARPEALLEMVRVNVEEGLGEPFPVADVERHLRGFGAVPEVAVDGRVLPQEWLATAKGWLKLDATDHHADHFFPGLTDIAWDVAGLGAELGLDRATLDGFAGVVADAAADPGLPARLPFHATAYLAARLGFSAFNADMLGETAEAKRMRGLAERYRRQLRTSVARLRALL
jgi:hypothetical protein